MDNLIRIIWQGKQVKLCIFLKIRPIWGKPFFRLFFGKNGHLGSSIPLIFKFICFLMILPFLLSPTSMHFSSALTIFIHSFYSHSTPYPSTNKNLFKIIWLPYDFYQPTQNYVVLPSKRYSQTKKKIAKLEPLFSLFMLIKFRG